VQYDIAKGTASTSIFGINAAGNFAGATGSGGPNQGFINIQGTVTTFYASGSDNTFALGINKLNQVVGQYYDASNNSHGYYRDASGNISEIIYPGAAQTACTGINDSGEIVGWYVDSLGHYHGFTDNNGTFQTVNMIQIFGVSNSGAFAGFYTGPTGTGSQNFGLLAAPTALNLTTLQIPGAQTTSTYGVNNANVLVGQYTDSQGNSHGMIISGNQVTNLDDPKAATGQTVAQGINNNNVVVGYYLDSNNFAHGFQYSNGSFTDVGPAGNIESWAYNINDAGQIAGVFYDSNGLEHGYVKNGSTYTQFDAPGSNNSTALWGINNAGELTGQYLDAGGLEEAFIYKAGQYTSVNVPGATQSFAHSVNKNGSVVLTIFDFYGNSHGALLNGTTFYIFDDPTGTSLRADGLNDSGLMVGRFIPNGNTVFQGFKGTL